MYSCTYTAPFRWPHQFTLSQSTTIPLALHRPILPPTCKTTSTAAYATKEQRQMPISLPPTTQSTASIPSRDTTEPAISLSTEHFDDCGTTQTRWGRHIRRAHHSRISNQPTSAPLCLHTLLLSLPNTSMVISFTSPKDCHLFPQDQQSAKQRVTFREARRYSPSFTIRHLVPTSNNKADARVRIWPDSSTSIVVRTVQPGALTMNLPSDPHHHLKFGLK